MKKNKSPYQTNAKVRGVGVPPNFNILLITSNEPLNHALTIKLWPSVAKYINQHGGSDFLRSAVIEKLERLADHPSPARCDQCANLGERDGQPYCEWQFCTFLPQDRRDMSQVFSCEGFKFQKARRKRER